MLVNSKIINYPLNNSTTYYWRICSNNSGRLSAWSSIWSFTTAIPPTVTDIDGNIYHSVIIGNQTWTVENLKTTKYNDGTAIPNVTNNTTWGNLTTGAYCWYNNSPAYKNVYGALYNWYAVNTGKLAPVGWHVSTDAEWDTLRGYLISTGYNYDNTTIGNKIAKAMAAQTNWSTYRTAGTIGCNLSLNNSSGFSALPGGFRYYNGDFEYMGYGGEWWSSVEGGQSYAYARGLDYERYDLSSYYNYEPGGYSVRLVKNN